MDNDVKNYNQRRWFYLREGFMKFAVGMGSDGMKCIPSFMKIPSGIQIALKSLTQKYERLQCWYYLKDGREL
jgi:hypothetical protein